MRVTHGKITRRSRNLRDQRACAQVNRPEAMKFRHGLGAVFACSVRFRVQKKRPGLRHPIKVNQGGKNRRGSPGAVGRVTPCAPSWQSKTRPPNRLVSRKIRRCMNLNALVGRRRRAADCTPYRPQICRGTRLVGRVTPCAPSWQSKMRPPNRLVSRKIRRCMNLNALVGRRRRAEDCTPYRPQICHGTRLVDNMRTGS